jgi:polyhydroxybutyrate depolymerase
MRRPPPVLALAATLLLAAVACSSGASDDGVATTTAATTAATSAERAEDERATTDPSTASPGCAAEQPAPGRTDETVRSGDDERGYVRYVPTGIDAESPAPLIVDLTAYSPASMQEAFSGFTTEAPDGSVKADEEGIVVVTPEPTNGAGALLTWNYVDTPGWSDDQRFVADLLDDVEADLCVDPSRIFLSGFAVGGVFGSIVACEHAERFAALGTVAGLFAPEGCAPAKALPVVSFHGTGDRFIPFDGGIGAGPADLPLSPETIEGLTFMATREGAVASSEAWAGHGRCDPDPTVEVVADGVERRVWSGCDDDARVELHVIEGGEHTWPGSTGMDGYADILGPVSDQLDATDLMWDFFEAAPR